eukprot:1130687-Prymnesium_polylepis.1
MERAATSNTSRSRAAAIITGAFAGGVNSVMIKSKLYKIKARTLRAKTRFGLPGDASLVATDAASRAARDAARTHSARVPTCGRGGRHALGVGLRARRRRLRARTSISLAVPVHPPMHLPAYLPAYLPAHLPAPPCAPPCCRAMAPKKSIEKKPAGGKKPLSGYMKFAQERRASLKEEQPSLTFGEVGNGSSSLGNAGTCPPPCRPPHPPTPFTAPSTAHAPRACMCMSGCNSSHVCSAAHPRLQTGKVLGGEWRALSDAEKAKYKA